MKNKYPHGGGHFGPFGGRYVAETLMPALLELEQAYREARRDPAFQREWAGYLKDYAGRETPLNLAANLTGKLKGPKIYLKREDLNHTGSHKINNTLGQALLARRMGKGRVIAETGAGQHGVATATVAALFGLSCLIFMGQEDLRRQSSNGDRMKALGAEIFPVASGTATLKDAMNEAIRHWVSRVRDTYYVIGSTAGPHPYPLTVRDFQSVIGREVKRQLRRKEGRLPDVLVACVGGGSNALGLFYPFKDQTAVEMIGVEAAGADLVEIGVPFSDPTADGPVIQAASRRSLKNGTTLAEILDLVARLRCHSEIPVILFSYYNPIWRFGPERFARAARTAGVDGVLVVDLPPEESGELRTFTDPLGLDFISLLAPTTGRERMKGIADRARGFLYYISVTGITGTAVPEWAARHRGVARVRRLTKLPVVVGFGLADPDQVRAAAAAADGVVVGSALVRLIHESADQDNRMVRLTDYVSRLKKALKEL